MFEHILIPLDGSPLAECVLPHGVALARAFGARVTLLNVLGRRAAGPTRSVDPLDWQIRRAEANVYLEGAVNRLQEVGLRVESRLLDGQAAEQIVDFAHGNEVELILLSSHGRSGLSGWNISSVVQKIILRAYVPTMIVRAYQAGVEELGQLRYRRLLVPLDGSQRAECALPLATALAQSHESRLLLVHLVRRPEMPRRVPLTDEETEMVNRITERNRLAAARYLEQLCSRLPAEVETRLEVSDDLVAALHGLVEQEAVDLVVMSAHGQTGRDKWAYGTTALSFIVYGTTPLLIVQDLPWNRVEKTQAELAAEERGGH
jgi:nucleotide-binding universal stress UspA family protein